MSRKWKPGDVALVTCSGAEAEVMLRDDTNTGWYDIAGTFYWDKAVDQWKLEEVRPLVVIDPEDREQVERLAIAYSATASARKDDEYLAWENRSAGARQRIVADLQAALREYADPKPPKPEEPTGLGAVVEDAEGKRHVRRPVYGNESNAWCDEIGCGRPWQRVTAVRVLSEGVTE